MRNNFDKFIIWGAIIFSIIILLGIVIFATKEGKANTNITTYQSTDQEKPAASVSAIFKDLGKMKKDEEKTAVFALTNSGQKPLIIYDITSSCGCTFGKIKIENQESPEFSMHSNSKWQGVIAPGKSAEIEVIYRPYLMPIQGEVVREVFVKTNDPLKDSLTYTVKAFVDLN